MLFDKLPIEEVLFFIIVPLMTVLTYLALVKLTGLVKSNGLVKLTGRDKTKENPHDLL